MMSHDEAECHGVSIVDSWSAGFLQSSRPHRVISISLPPILDLVHRVAFGSSNRLDFHQRKTR